MVKKIRVSDKEAQDSIIFENRIDELIACNSMTKANHLSKEQDAMEQKLIDVMNLNRHVYRKHEKW